MDYSLLLMSFLVGLMIGLTSMGGAALMAPFLILVLGVRPAVAVQSDLIYGAITKIVGAIIHWRQNTVDVPTALSLAKGSIPGGVLGSLVVFMLPRWYGNADVYLRQAIGAVLVVVGLVLIARLLGCPRIIDPSPHMGLLRGWGSIVWGAVVGFAVGLTSVGSGSLIAPFLMLLFPSAPAKVVGTDVFHAAILVSVTGALHAGSSPIQWVLITTLLAGSIPGVFLGSFLVPHLPAKTIRAGLAVLLLATGIKMV